MKPLLVGMFCVLLTGCATTGPAGQESLNRLLPNAMPADVGNVQFSQSAEWLPDMYGMTTSMDYRSGVFVLTDTSVLFFQWLPGSNRYEPIFRTEYSDIAKHEVLKFGRSRSIVVVGKDTRPQTFNMTGKTKTLIDSTATETAAAILNEKVSAK